jgi:Rod binding domain-containing protein
MMKIASNMPAMQGASQVPSAVQAKLHKAAEDFTAVALNELLKPMFDTEDTSRGPFGGGAAEEQFKPMIVTEIAKQIARSGGLGLAEPVYQQMLRLQEGRK